MNIPPSLTGEQVAKRATWLAYEASEPVGMGFLQYRTDLTEDTLWDALEIDVTTKDGVVTNGVYIDYGYGRMMKYGITFTLSEVKGRGVTVSPDYQSWCKKYPTYDALIEAAIASLS